MAVSAGRQMVDGSNIMLFSYETSTGLYKSIAHGTSHSLSLSADTQDINTKDAGVYGLTEVNKINWEIQAEHMYTHDGYDEFFTNMTNKTPIKVLFGLKADAEIGGTPADVNINADGNWTPNSSYIYSGNAIITSLNWNAEAGQKSTVSVTLNGQGAISKGQPSA